MKLPLLLALAGTLTCTSCQNFQWPWKKAAPAADPYAAAAGQYNAYPQQNYAQPGAQNYAAPNYSTGGEQAQVYPANGGAAPAASNPSGTQDWNNPGTAPSKPSHSSGGAGHTGGSYIVVRGDTLYGISRKQGTSVTKIMQANGLQSTSIQPGQKLRMP